MLKTWCKEGWIGGKESSLGAFWFSLRLPLIGQPALSPMPSMREGEEAWAHGLAYALYWPEETPVIIHFVPGYGFCRVGSYCKVISKSCLCPYARLSIYSRCVSTRERLLVF